MKTVTRFLLGVLIGVTMSLAIIRSGHAEQRYVPVVEKTIGSVVKITARYFVPITDPKTKKTVFMSGTSLGSGVIVSTNGHILTCEHIISGNPILIDVQLQTSTTTHISATVLRRSFERDIALLKLVNYSTATVPVKLAPEMPKIGEEVIGIGHPYGFDWSVTSGIVSGLNREGLAINLLQTDAAINPGNSGGPLFNLEGQVVGLNQSIMLKADNMGFAVSVREIRNFLEVFKGLEQVF